MFSILTLPSDDDAVKETVFIPASYSLHDFASFLFPTMVNESDEYSYMFYIDGICYVDAKESVKVDMKPASLQKCLAIWLEQTL